MSSVSTTMDAGKVETSTKLGHYIVQLKEGDKLAGARETHLADVEKWCKAAQVPDAVPRITWKFDDKSLDFYTYTGVFTTEIVTKIKAATQIVKAVNADVNVEIDIGPELEWRQAKDWPLALISPVTGSKKEPPIWWCPLSGGKGVTVYIVEIGHFWIDPGDVEFKGRSYRQLSLPGSTLDNQNEHGHIITRCAVGNQSGMAPNSTIVTVSTDANTLMNATGKLHDDIQGKAVNGSILATRLLTLVWRDPAFDREKSVINCSWSVFDFGSGEVAILRNLVEKMATKVTIVCAAGNNGSNLDIVPKIPACIKEVITVGAHNREYGRWKGANFGSGVDIFAPGEGIGIFDLGGGVLLRRVNGTSCSAAFTSGIVACMISENLRKGLGPLTPSQIKEKLLRNALVDPESQIKYVTTKFDVK